MNKFANRSRASQFIAIFFCLIAFSSNIEAKSTSGVFYSPKSITKSMDLAVRSYSMNYLYTPTPNQSDSANKGIARSDSLRLKNPNTALLIAVFPGFVFHGSGHFYARKSLTGLALFATESFGLILWLRGLNPFGESSNYSAADQAEFITGMALFFGSWAYDLIGAPLAVNNENEKIMSESK